MVESESPRWLTAAEQSAWRKFIAVVELVPGVLDSQLQRDAELTHFEYFTLAMLSEAEGQTLRMSRLALETNSTLPRLSHVASRLEKRGLVERAVSGDDRRATDITLTSAGWEKVAATAPGHARTVVSYVMGQLDPEDVDDLDRISAKLLERLDPDRRMSIDR